MYVIAAILLVFQLGCEKDEVSPITKAQEIEAVKKLLMGRWKFTEFTSDECSTDANECVSRLYELNENDFFEFTRDSVSWSFFGYKSKSLSMELISLDTLLVDGLAISDIFIINHIDNESLTLEYYMDHSSPFVNDDLNITDYYYLNK